jgi:WD40 repeat protein
MIFDVEQGRLGECQPWSDDVAMMPTMIELTYDAEREVQAYTRSMLALTINKVPGHGHLVLTAGVEGLAKLWVSQARGSLITIAKRTRMAYCTFLNQDLRQSTNKVPIVSIRHPSSIFSVTFAPPGLDSTSTANAYFLGLENGSIYRYDRRMGTRSLYRMTAAHKNKSVMALDWKEGVEGDGNTGNGGWLASAGLDKTVKVSFSK